MWSSSFCWIGPESVERREVRARVLGSTRGREEIMAWVKLREGQAATVEEIRDYCRDEIAHCEVPRYVRFVDVFPMTVTGKVQKFVMRDRA